MASFVVAIVLVAVVAVSCGNRRHSGLRRAVVTIEPLRYFASRIGGGEWSLASLVPPGFSPEEFVPSVSEMVKVANAQCLFKIGNLGFETTWLNDAIGHNKALKIYDTSVGLPDATFDPHTWTSPANAKTICRNIAQAFATADPSNAALYMERMAEEEASVDSLDRALRQILADLPSRSFVIAHPALTQFARDYNLHQIAIEHNGKEPTPASIRQLITQAKKEKVGVVFVQQEFSEHTAKVIAEETHSRVVIINPLAYDWPQQMLHIAKALKNGR